MKAPTNIEHVDIEMGLKREKPAMEVCTQRREMGAITAKHAGQMS
jgi:hypothetical protein